MKQNELDKTWLREIRLNLAEAPLKAPTDGWERIAATLQQDTTAERHHISAYLSRAAAAIALLLVAGETYDTLREPPYNNIVEEEHFAAEQVVEKTETEEEVMPQVMKIREERRNMEKVEAEVLVATESEPIVHEETAETSQLETVTTLRNDEETSTLLAMGSQKGAVSVKRWSMGMNVGGSRDLTNKGALQNIPEDELLDSDVVLGDNDNYSSYPYSDRELMEVRNQWSWSFGLSVRRQITQRLSAESGLAYTLLSSDIIVGYPCLKDHKAERLDQKLHYLGIPLSLNITLLESPRWQLYASAGVMAERCIAARLGNKSFTIDAWQWSVNGAIGGQYNLSKRLGIYLEPRLNYYFDDHAGIPSIRTESPCNLNLRLGLRLSF